MAWAPPWSMPSPSGCASRSTARGWYTTRISSRGKPTTDLLSSPLDGLQADRRGTSIMFQPDPEIFPSIEFDFNILAQRFKEMAFLNKRMEIRFKSDWHFSLWPNNEVTYYFDGGIASFVGHLNENKTPLHKEPIYVEKQVNGTKVEAALQYTGNFTEFVYAFANCINNVEGGTHLTGFRSALTRVLNDYGRKQKFLKDNEPNLAGEDTREGLTAVISVKLGDPQFEGQTKEKLGNPEVRNQVEGVVAEALLTYLEEHPQDGRRILDKCVTSQRARDAARKARDLIIRKNAMDGGALPGKLADCSDKNPENCELYLVEGESAGGTAKMGRDRTNQAVLPLRGKILNVEKARADKMLAHEEIRALTIALGAGLGEDFDLAKLRYHRVIIMTDADVDGSHIRTLLLTFFFRNMHPLISHGHLYIAPAAPVQDNVGQEGAVGVHRERARDGHREAKRLKPCQHPALQGPWRDDGRPALGHDHGPRGAYPAPGGAGRPDGRGPHLLRPHGRCRRAEAELHPDPRPRGQEPRRVARLHPQGRRWKGREHVSRLSPSLRPPAGIQPPATRVRQAAPGRSVAIRIHLCSGMFRSWPVLLGLCSGRAAHSPVALSSIWSMNAGVIAW